MHPSHIPANVQKTKKPTPLMPKKLPDVVPNSPLLTRPGAM